MKTLVTDCSDSSAVGDGAKVKFRVKDFRPARDSMLVAQLPPETMTAGGLHLPDKAQYEKQMGVVLRVPEDGAVDCPYAEGDYVLFLPVGGNKVCFDDREDLLVLQWHSGEGFDDILGSWSRDSATVKE